MRLRSALVSTLAAVSVTLVAAPAPAQAGSPAHRAPGDSVTMRLSEAVAALPAAEESRAGYVRTAFRHWIDADRDGCNTRKEVIISEAVEAPQVTQPGCVLTGGQWFSPYDNVTVEDAGALDVDHVVPLAEAWDSGASTWTPAEREAYANDLGDERALIAVSARSNRQKADKDVAEWLPTAGYVCRYITDWTVVKTRWQLSVDPAEQATLERLSRSCPDETITVQHAR
ncbi:HNH endonuclease family protein [Streptomyces sp. NPDC049577]|uniref:HNH endonuclease family protein n=1 Tax=Streptomyces sp. NPDC049577 TaxID=3155153 RepID=UPI0034408B45